MNEQKFYASTDGSRIDQYIIRANPNFNVTAVNARTAISSRAVRSVVHREWATSTSKSTTGNAKRSKGEEVMKLKASSDPGKYDLVLHLSHLWLTIHESVGHPTELDRAL